MKTEVDPRDFAKVMSTLITSGVKSVTRYVSPKLVVRATWRHKPKASRTREEAVVTFGTPNYLETAFAKAAVKAGEPFPIKKLQLRAWPKPRKAKKG